MKGCKEWCGSSGGDSASGVRMWSHTCSISQGVAFGDTQHHNKAALNKCNALSWGPRVLLVYVQCSFALCFLQLLLAFILFLNLIL